jgi:hypothetical protein
MFGVPGQALHALLRLAARGDRRRPPDSPLLPRPRCARPATGDPAECRAPARVPAGSKTRRSQYRGAALRRTLNMMTTRALPRRPSSTSSRAAVGVPGGWAGAGARERRGGRRGGTGPAPAPASLRSRVSAFRWITRRHSRGRAASRPPTERGRAPLHGWGRLAADGRVASRRRTARPPTDRPPGEDTPLPRRGAEDETTEQDHQERCAPEQELARLTSGRHAEIDGRIQEALAGSARARGYAGQFGTTGRLVRSRAPGRAGAHAPPST